MNKSDLIRKLANDHGLPVVLVQKVINDLFETIKEDVLAGNTTMVSGFGKFFQKSGREKRRLDPRSGKVIVLPARTYPAFDPSVGFKKAARKRGEENENGT